MDTDKEEDSYKCLDGHDVDNHCSMLMLLTIDDAVVDFDDFFDFEHHCASVVKYRHAIHTKCA